MWNARIATTAFETLHHVEVLPRNVVDQRFAPVDPSVSATATGLTDPTILKEASRRRVAETIHRVEGKFPTRGGVRPVRASRGSKRPGQLPRAGASTRLRSPLGTSHSTTQAKASPVLREPVRALAAQARASAILPAERWR